MKKNEKTVFEHIFELADDYRVAGLAVKTARGDAEDALEEARGRIEAEKQQAAQRIAELTEKAEDGSRGPVVQGMARRELEQLKNMSFAPRDFEIEAALQALEEAEAAVAELAKIREEIRSALDVARKELEQVRAATVGDQQTALYGRSLDAIRKTISELEAQQ